jgi:signal transduction histidine kinase
MIRTILRNLISNAIKFTYPGGQITLKAVKNTHECLISVSDNGVGISKETLEMLFRIDQNNSTAGTQNETGTGLGLILCKELTERHEGRIWGESQPGKGSIFYFSLPYNNEIDLARNELKNKKTVSHKEVQQHVIKM